MIKEKYGFLDIYTKKYLRQNFIVNCNLTQALRGQNTQSYNSIDLFKLNKQINPNKKQQTKITRFRYNLIKSTHKHLYTRTKHRQTDNTFFKEKSRTSL